VVSPILEVAIGVILVFLVVAVIVSTITEGISGILRTRARTLERGIEAMLGQAGKNWLYGQPLIATSTAPSRSLIRKPRKPSYIDAVNFSTSLVGPLVGELSAPTNQTLLAAILPTDPQARRQNVQTALQGLDPIETEAAKRAGDADALSRYLLDQMHAAPDQLTVDKVAKVVGTLDEVKAAVTALSSGDPAKAPLTDMLSAQPPPPDTDAMLATVTGYVAPLDPPSLAQLVSGLRGFGLSQQAMDALKRLAQGADNNVVNFREAVEDWFDREMARVSGAYNRWSQVVMFGIALAVAIGANVSAYTVGRALWLDPGLRARAVAAAEQTVSPTTTATGTATGSAPAASGTSTSTQTTTTTLPTAPTYQQLQKLGMPIGWSKSNWPKFSWDTLLVVIGWLIVAVAASMGAPFWFDTLNKFVNLRTSGPPPDTAAVQRAKSQSSSSS
jgi:hypothetical protein